MCGIAGIFNKSGVAGSQLGAMAKAVRHRGPDDEGYMLLDRSGAPSFFRGDDTVAGIPNFGHINAEQTDRENIGGLAHRRLSIIDLSPAAHQPLAVDDDRYAIVYNGEVYNYLEIREVLISKGYDFKSQSDAEVILNAYREWGEQCVEEFVGMWAFAIWDKQKQVVFLSRDRFGVKPLYYFQVDGIFAFASEIKSLFTLKFVEKKINESNLFQYVVWGRNSDPEATLFQGIQELPPGCNCLYFPTDQSLRKNIYYDLKQAVNRSRDQSNKGDPIEKYRFLFNRSLDLHLRSDVPVGSCLSGGLDSSSIAAEAAMNMKGAGFNTFTASYQDPEIDESSFARSVCEKYSNLNPFFTYPNARDFWKDFDLLIRHQDLPIASSSIYAQWEVMKMARQQGMKVLLDGQGADESLGGYAFFSGFRLLDLLKKLRFFSFVHEARQARINRSVSISHELKRALFHHLPSVLKERVFFGKSISRQFMNSDFSSGFKSLRYPEEFGSSYTERCYDSFRFGLRELLRYEDRNSMAFSIESRVPFLDHRLVEYSLALADQWKIRDGWTKFVLRKSMEKMLPAEVTWRKDKKGFVTPQLSWKSELKSELSKYLNESTATEIFNLDRLRIFVSQDDIDPNSLSDFWKTISIMKWLDLNSIKVAR